MIAGKELLVKMPQKWEIALPFKYNAVLLHLKCYIMYVIKGGLLATESDNQRVPHSVTRQYRDTLLGLTDL